MTEFKKFLIATIKALTALLLVFLPLLYFNVIIDPYGVFLHHPKNTNMENNKRFMKVNYLIRHPDQFDAFIFGSSRANFLDPEKIPGSKYYNMTYSMGTPHDHYQDIRIMLKNGVKIKNLLIGIDYLSLLINPSIQSNDLLRQQYPESFFDKIIFYKKYLLFRPTLETLELSTKEGTVDKEQMFTKGIIFNKAFDSIIEARKRMHITSRKFKIPFGEYNADPDIDRAVNEISKLIQLADSNQIRCTFFINPTHYLTYLQLNLEKYFDALRKLAKLTDFYDFSGLNSIALDNYYFNETSHFRLPVGDMIIAKIFHCDDITIPTDFGRKVTSDNIDEQIAFHRNLLSDYFIATELNTHYRQPSNLPAVRHENKLNGCKVTRINCMPAHTETQPVLVSIPWLKIEGTCPAKTAERNAIKFFLQIGDRVFDMESCAYIKYAQNNENVEWNATIPLRKLKPGVQDIEMLAQKKNTHISTSSKSLARIDIFPVSKSISPSQLKQISTAGTFHIDRINGLQYSKYIYINDVSETTTLHLSGWAIDPELNCESGGVIVSLNGKQYLSQMILQRDDLSRYFNNPQLNFAGIGISIPCGDLTPGVYELSLNVLNHDRTACYLSEDVVKIFYKNKYGTRDDVLAGLREQDHTTDFSIDQVNGKNIPNKKDPIDVSGSMVEITGWAVDHWAADKASDVYLDIDGKLFRVYYGLQRDDVAKAMSNPNYLNSGWTAMIPTDVIGKGAHNLSLKIISHDKKSYYSINKQLILLVDYL